MDNKMLIDATHPEETRVVVLRDGRIEEFDYESAAKKLLRGNIYLAKVTRVEPSLQAAFVDYGGNRHGFLAFNEIHPDYYQIPVADRQAILRAEAEAERHEDEDEPSVAAEDNGSAHTGEDGPEADGNHEGRAAMALEADSAERLSAPGPEEAASPEHAGGTESDPDDTSDETIEDAGADAPPEIGLVENQGVEEVAGNGEAERIEEVGAEDALEEASRRRRRQYRPYKIQEVIRRRQIMLVQVVKEERGTKGAALTTYLSLAGRYTVLMPNTGRGGGISRKITNAVDRKRIKELVSELEVPEGMGLIVRTAGASRTKAEIKRDFEYLLRLWESVRELTLKSTAPALVYEEGDLIKRSIRDLYSKDIDEIVVAGEPAYEEAHEFMRMLMPTHVKNVRKYEEPEPLFSRYQIERQLNAMFSPFVTLRSGGYLVINQTEALVAIDINSGKSTREHSIEETALKTNLEAADEIARQLRLRDLAGLIVIDFIDMEERRNNRQVERRLKEALRFDRARIQVGRISHFGLLEMSRQRMRTGVLEGSTTQCPHCQGTGVIRSTESVSLAVLRGLEDALLSGARGKLVANTSVETALYLLNSKRHFLHDMEERYGITISINGTDTIKGANFTIERVEAAGESESARKVVVKMEAALDSETVEAEGEGDRKGRRKRKRRRGRDRGDREEMRTGEVTVEQERDRPCVEADEQPIEAMDQPIQADLEAATLEEETRAEGSEDVRPAREENGARKRRRGRRGGRRNRRERDREHDARLAGADGEQPGIASQGTHNGEPIEPAIGEAGAEAGPLGNGFEYRHPERDLLIAEAPALEALPAADQPDSYEPRPDEQIQPLQPAAEAEVVPEHATKTPENESQPPSSEPPRRGWWQRRLLG